MCIAKYRSNGDKCWVCDILHLRPIYLNPPRKKAYIKIAAMMDVESRLILQTSFFEEKSAEGIVNLFRDTVNMYGTPEMILVDNSHYFRSKTFEVAMAEMGVKVGTVAHYNGGMCLEEWFRALNNYLMNNFSSATKYDEYTMYNMVDALIYRFMTAYHKAI